MEVYPPTSFGRKVKCHCCSLMVGLDNQVPVRLAWLGVDYHEFLTTIPKLQGHDQHDINLFSTSPLYELESVLSVRSGVTPSPHSANFGWNFLICYGPSQGDSQDEPQSLKSMKSTALIRMAFSGQQSESRGAL